MTKRALITGITGQDGSYLAEFLLDKGYEVFGMVRRTSTVNFERIEHIQDRIDAGPRRPARPGLADRAALASTGPHEVYNLAAQTFVQTSFGQPVLTGEVTALGVTRLLEAIRLVDPDIRFYQASSAARCSARCARCPRPRRRRSTRAAPTAWPRSTATGSRSTTARATTCSPSAASCSTTSRPRRGLEFVTRKITDGVARIKLGLADELRLGNLDAQRDWGFAGDYVRAMWLMLQQDTPDDYVVATGETHSVREFCEVAFDHVGLDWQDYVVIDEALLPPGRGRPAGRHAAQGRNRAGLEPRRSASRTWSR